MADGFESYEFKYGMPKLPEVELGARICKLIKKVYFAEKEWVSCCTDVAFKFSDLKKWARKRYDKKDGVELLDLLSKYDEDDLREAMDA